MTPGRPVAALLVAAFVAPALAADPAKLAELRKDVKPADGLDVTVFAAPPDVSYPTCLAAAPDGTVFVGVDLNGSLGTKAGKGRVVRCIDKDHDGGADAFNTFCEVESARGLWWDGDKTLYVLHPPVITAYTDTDGDGKADEHKDVVTGLGFDLKFRGADHTTNGFRYAIDGFFYVAVGDYGAVKATGTDGRSIQLRGGGVVRVRPDGTGLEVVSTGQRNIYDVAVSPTLDLFTRDNTNDGGGWNVRLSHVVPTGEYGYPRLFKNFPDEIVPALADYGGGSPCGAIYLDEPALPKGLFFCEWGRSEITSHPLTANGAAWKAGAGSLLKLSRPTDIDADGCGQLFISSWKDGGFDFSKPDVGYVARVVQKGWKYEPFPDLKKATDAELLTYFASPSGVRREYAQREMLRRGAKAEFVSGLEKLAAGDGPISVRVAAIVTLPHLLGPKATDVLAQLAKQDAVREYALRALADAPERRDAAPVEAFLAALRDANPRVRLQAVIGLSRLGAGSWLARASNGLLLLGSTSDPDVTVAHCAVNALVALKASEACFIALDPYNAALQPRALAVLQRLHEPKVVDFLVELLKSAKPDARKGLLVALARLYQTEAEWDGKWWSTRPDTTGPYYKPATWGESSKIAAVLKDAVAAADVETLRWLLPELIRHRVELPEVTTAVVAAAAKDAGLRRVVVDVMASRPAPPAEVVPLFVAVAGEADEAPAARATALRGLAKFSNQATARNAVVAALTAADPLPKEVEDVYGEFARDGKRNDELDAFKKLTADPDPRKKELGYGVLAAVADRPTGPAKARQAAQEIVQGAWAKPATALPLMRAVGRLGLTSFAPQLRKIMAGDDPALAAPAKAAFAALKLDPATANLPLIGTQNVDAVAKLAAAVAKPNAELGGKLFARIGCANCHATAANEPLKGPLLAGITTRYKKEELLESILKPSAKIAQGFETFVIDTADGKTVTGFVVRESGTELEVRDGTGAAVVVKKDDIEAKKPGKLSVMPEKLVDDLTVPELAAILAYLDTLKGK